MRIQLLSKTWFLAAAAVVFAGCSSRGPEGPPTVNVSGKIVVAQGPPVEELFSRDSAVEFQSIDNPGARAYGEIAPDGSFKLTTSKDGAFRNGVVEGLHRVRLMLDEQVAGQINPAFLKFETSGLTAQVSGEQELVFVVSQ